MTEQYYKCTLLSDVILNNKMATEGNMTTLDYIAGSNFLGVVANGIYAKHIDKAYIILHTGEVSFGDAHISLDGKEVSYAMPYQLFKDKLDKTKTWVHHLLEKEHFDKFKEEGIQLKQERIGYLTPTGHLLKSPEKNFALKSAQDRDERRSKDGAMFGFESLKAGQVYVFSVRYSNAEYQRIVEEFLKGQKRIGKSKTAQYGQVDIQPISNPTTIKSVEKPEGYTIVYAESNLCFFNEYGQTTFQPEPEDLGLIGGKVYWEKSQIRTYAYSPWNGIRNTPNTQRDCILKGSVFYVKDAVIPEKKTDSVGEYEAEGLGRVIYNPMFLEGEKDSGEWTFKINTPKKPDDSEEFNKTPLGDFLRNLQKSKKDDLDVSQAVQETLKLEASKELMKITPSQWGGIRAYAENAKDVTALEKQIFEDFISHGVALDRYWSKGGRTKMFKEIFNDNKSYGTPFFVKYSSEMAKEAQKLKNKK